MRYAAFRPHASSHPLTSTLAPQVPFLESSSEDSNVRTALAWSLPRALFVWAVALAAAQVPVVAQRALGARVLAAVALLCVVASLPWARWCRAVSERRNGRAAAEDAIV